MLRAVPVLAIGGAGRDRPAETDDAPPRSRPPGSTRRSRAERSKAFVILPASTDADESVWTESERGAVLVGTRKARRARQRSHDRWRRVMSVSGVTGTSPEDVQARIVEALAAIEHERGRLDTALRHIERGCKSDVAVDEVKRLKKLKLRCKDDAARLRKAASMAAEARTLGEGSFGRVFLGRDVDTGEDVAVKVEDSAAVDEELVCESLSWDEELPRSTVHDETHDEHGDRTRDVTCAPKTPLTREHDALRRVTGVGFPRVRFFGTQRRGLLGSDAPCRVLVMDLLGPSLEDMSWRCAAGGPLSRKTCLMVCDQALTLIHKTHEAGYVHGDVKPDNLLLGAAGVKGGARTVHLVDFGLAVPGPKEGELDDDEVLDGDTAGGEAPGAGDSPPGDSPPIDSLTGGSIASSPPLAPGSGFTHGTPTYSSVRADAGGAATYADDLESLAWTCAYLRAGTPCWTPAVDRSRIEAVVACKATATAADVATDPIDAAWIWALIAHARSLRFGERFDLGYCRDVIDEAFAAETGGAPMAETPFDWEEAGVVVG